MFNSMKYAVMYSSGNLNDHLKNSKNRQEFVKTIIDQGVVAIKIGQWMSHREDILSNDMINALKPLQKRIPHIHSYEETCRILDKGFGFPHNKIYSHINEKVLGSGSISQVYKCSLWQLNDKPCVIKVHRKSSINSFERELSHWRRLIWGCSLFKIGFAIDLEGFLLAIEKQFSYENEYKNYRNIKKNLENLDFIILPKIVNVTPFCITMTYIHGHSYSYIQEHYPEYTRDMSEKLMMSYFWMVYNGYVHTDMHDGNFVYIIDEEDDCNNKIALFDYGLGFSLPSYGKNGLAMLLWKAFIKRNTKSMRKLFRIILKDNPGDDKLRKIQPFRMIVNGGELSFCNWLEDILSQIGENNCIIETKYMYVFMGFILLARSFVYIDHEGNKLEFDVFGSSLRAMSKSKYKPMSKVGKELLNDFNKFSIESGTIEKINKQKTVNEAKTP